MAETVSSLTVGGVDVEVVFKAIKHLHIGVYPPEGRVRVAAPLRLDEDTVRRAVAHRLAWIKRQRAAFLSVDRLPVRQLMQGESHYVWGRRRRLRVVERPGRAEVEVGHDWLYLYVPAGWSVEQRRKLLDRWYREQLRGEIPRLISKWENRLDTVVPDWTVRRMRTKWGTCNRVTRRLTFNVELAKVNPGALEYVVVHEMMHYFEPNHGDRFTELLDQALPGWRSLRRGLDDVPLADELWGVSEE